MVKKKQKDNIEDIEEIIEMGPVNEKYKIKINEQTLERVKNYFR